MRTREVFGQLEPGRRPVTLQTVASTWVLHISVGTVPLAKYSVYTASPLRVVGADARNGKLARFAADLCGFHAVRYFKTRILQALVNAGHDLAPDIFMEGGTAILSGELLVLIGSRPIHRRCNKACSR